MLQTTKHKILNTKIRGFLLLEVIVALSIFSMGMFSSMASLALAIRSASTSQYNLVAAALAQEGIEWVRNIRDSNWKNELPWNDGLLPGTFRAQWNKTTQFFNEPTQILRYAGTAHNQGFIYATAPANETLYSRAITITQISADEMQVVSTVSWTDKGRSRSISAEEHLFNWK